MANKLTEDLSKVLGEIAYSDRGVVGPILAKLEDSTKIRRDRFLHGAISVFLTYLVLGRSAELVCNLVGFVYPAYASIKALQTADTSDDTQWLTYWTVFAFFSVLEFASDQIVGWFPFYWLAKFLFLLWLYLPASRGAELVYVRFIVPFMEKYSERLAEIEREIKEQLTYTDKANQEKFNHGGYGAIVSNREPDKLSAEENAHEDVILLPELHTAIAQQPPPQKVEETLFTNQPPYQPAEPFEQPTAPATLKLTESSNLLEK